MIAWHLQEPVGVTARAKPNLTWAIQESIQSGGGFNNTPHSSQKSMGLFFPWNLLYPQPSSTSSFRRPRPCRHLVQHSHARAPCRVWAAGHQGNSREVTSGLPSLALSSGIDNGCGEAESSDHVRHTSASTVNHGGKHYPDVPCFHRHIL